MANPIYELRANNNSMPLLSLNELRKQAAEANRWVATNAPSRVAQAPVGSSYGIPLWIRSAIEETTPIKLARTLARLGLLEELPFPAVPSTYEPGTIEQLASALLSIGIDPLTYLLGGVAVKAAGAVPKVAGLAGKLLPRAVAGATWFGGYEAARTPLQQLLDTGEVTLPKTLQDVASAVGMGAVMGGAEAVIAKVGLPLVKGALQKLSKNQALTKVEQQAVERIKRLAVSEAGRPAREAGEQAAKAVPPPPPVGAAQVPPTKPPVRPPTAVGGEMLPEEPLFNTAWLRDLGFTEKQVTEMLGGYHPKGPRTAAAETIEKVITAEVPETGQLLGDDWNTLAKAIAEARPAAKETAALRKEYRKAVAGKLAGYEEEAVGLEALPGARAIQKGRLPTVPFIPETQANEAAIRRMADYYWRSPNLQPYERVNAVEALERLFKTDEYLREWERKLLVGGAPEGMKEAVTKAIDAISQVKLRNPAAFEQFTSIINLPRAAITSADISYLLRQGALLAGQPKEMATSLNAAFKSITGKGFNEVRVSIEANPEFQHMMAHGMQLLEVTGKLQQMNEPFMTQLAAKVPVIKQSAQAFAGGINKLRSDTYYYYRAKYGDIPADWEWTELAHFLMRATGTGGLGFAKNLMPLLNTVFFSPSLLVSRFQAPFYIFSKSPMVRKVAARNLSTFFGSVATLTGLIKLSGVADVELDPRSTDFMKMRVGNVRLDPWAGYQQIFRFFVRELTGERKTTETGRIVPLPRGEEVQRFARTKLSPFAGLISDLLAGETMLGDELTLEPSSLRKQAYERLVPMAVQDLYDAFRVQGTEGAIIAVPALFGMGLQAYERTPFQEYLRSRDTVAQATYGRNWDELAMPEQQMLIKQFPEQVGAAAEATARAGTEYAYDLNLIQREQEQSHNRIRGRLSKSVQQILDNYNIRVGVSREISKDWWLNDERYSRYESLTVQHIEQLISGLLMQPDWARGSPDAQLALLQRFVNKARDVARTILVQGETAASRQQASALPQLVPVGGR